MTYSLSLLDKSPILEGENAMVALQRTTNGQLERAMVDIASASGVDATRTLASFVAGQAPAAQDMATRGQEQGPPTPRMV